LNQWGLRNKFKPGLILYLTSFFLPAVWFVDHFLWGFNCALLSLTLWRTDGLIESYQLGVRLTIFGGVINPLAVTYAVLRISDSYRWMRLVIAFAVLLCVPPMWVFLYLVSAPPFIGHAAWICGVLLMISDDIKLWLPTGPSR